MDLYSVTVGYIEHEAGICRDFGTYPTLSEAFLGVPRAETVFGHHADLTISIRYQSRILWSINSNSDDEFRATELAQHSNVLKAAA